MKYARWIPFVFLCFATCGGVPVTPNSGAGLNRGLLLLVPFQTIGSAAPTRGIASASFTRATTSTVYTSDPVVGSITSGTPGIGRPLSAGKLSATGNLGIHLHEAVSGIVARNEELDNAVWADVGTPIVVADVATTDPAGTLTADSIQDDSATVDEYQQQVLSVVQDTGNYIGTVWARCASAHDSMICLNFTGGVGCTTSTLCTQFTCSTTAWTRYSVSKPNTTCNTLNVQTKPTEGTPASLGTTIFWRPQAYKEVDEYQVDPQTTSGGFTLNQTVLTYSSVPAGDQGTVCTWIWAEVATGVTHQVGAWAGTENLRIYFNVTDLTFDTTGLVNNATVTVSGQLTGQTWQHYCATWNQTAQSINFYANGVLLSAGVSDTSWTAGGAYGTTLSLTDAASLTSGLNRFLSNYRVWNRPLSASEVLKLYNSESSLY